MAKVLKKKKGLKKRGGLGGRGGGGKQQSTRRPHLVKKTPPCQSGCPNRNDIRTAIMTISTAEHFGKTIDQAIEESFYTFLETTPFPSVCGRVCPHPCESECNRKAKEGAVGINKIERFIGDYGLEHGLKPALLSDEKKSQKVAVVGSGPGGMSCAYHLARLGYAVTVFEAFPKPGGMLRYGIPDYRLPSKILDGEINRILDMGVELKLDTAVGTDISMADLKKDFDATFIALGAHQGRLLRVKGEDAPNVFTGTDFLNRVNSGEKVDVGDKVVVIGGGDTAIDAARVARRLGAQANIVYRRTKTEMPAIDEEIVGADEEGVIIDFLAAPLEIYTENGKAVGMKCQRMELGEPDSSGRRRPVPIEGDTFDLEFSTLIAAISQAPNFNGFEEFIEGKDWFKVDERYQTKQDENVYSGGDDVNLGIAIDAIYHGRIAARTIHEKLIGAELTEDAPMVIVRHDKMQLDYYDEMQRVKADEMPVAERLKTLDAEITSTLDLERAVAETKRCMSCGNCFDCGTCWGVCGENVFSKPLEKALGKKYTLKLESCIGCDKCAEACPCGFIEMH